RRHRPPDRADHDEAPVRAPPRPALAVQHDRAGPAPGAPGRRVLPRSDRSRAVPPGGARRAAGDPGRVPGPPRRGAPGVPGRVPLHRRSGRAAPSTADRPGRPGHERAAAPGGPAAAGARHAARQAPLDPVHERPPGYPPGAAGPAACAPGAAPRDRHRWARPLRRARQRPADRDRHAAGGRRVPPRAPAVPLRPREGPRAARGGRPPARLPPAGPRDARDPDARDRARPAVGEDRRHARSHGGGAGPHAVTVDPRAGPPRLPDRGSDQHHVRRVLPAPGPPGSRPRAGPGRAPDGGPGDRPRPGAHGPALPGGRPVRHPRPRPELRAVRGHHPAPRPRRTDPVTPATAAGPRSQRRRAMRLPIATKLALLVIPLVLVPFVGIGYVLYSTTRATLEVQLQEELQARLRQVGLRLRPFLQERELDLDDIASLPLLIDYDTQIEYGLVQEAEVTLQKLAEHLGQFVGRRGSVVAEVRYVDHGGAELVRAQAAGVYRVGPDQSRLPYFQRVRAMPFPGGRLVTVERSESLGIDVLRLAQPIYSKWQEFRGVVVLDVPIAYFAGMLADALAGRQAITFIADASGAVLAPDG